MRGTVILAVVTLLFAGCASLPKLDARTASTALTDTADTPLGRYVQTANTADPDKSGIYALGNPEESFAARVLLVRQAQRSLDVQYYIWHADTTGYLLFEECWNAAERGVRVRLLLDDNNTSGLDDMIAALDSHANVEVRLFNPFANRGFRAWGYVTDFGRLNRRMHNKSLTADTQVTIVGGRNVGDEYFGAGEGMVFADLDVLAAGRIARDVADAFDLYWNSDSAYPAELIVGKAAVDAVPELKEKFAAVRTSPEAAEYLDAVRRTRLIEALLADQLTLDWSATHLVYDEPAKALGEVEASELLFTRLQQALGKPQREVDLISPYFVPGAEGTRALAALPGQGVRLRVLTNSLAATDVGAVHAGYAKRRETLLRAGVQIYELKPDPAEIPAREKAESKGKGSSAASLHAKTFSVDRNRVFVGSFNFDPRSYNLNTELGVVIESPKLAAGISNTLDRDIARTAYEVTLKDDGLEWLERTDQGETRYDKEPKTSFWKRFGVGFMSILPIEWML
ncbi:MAG TPA: phospholipase D-like domain-containing protein [Steroidobacteraceae bacterium]|nr:phospholipase D-like domain-containing protein [Steroidobacteraceae bacterium]